MTSDGTKQSNSPANSPTSTVTPAAVVEDAFQAYLWIDERVAAFPAAARRQLGHRAVDATLDALAAVTEATYTPRGAARTDRLVSANRRLAVLRILLRAARERRYLSIAQHEHALRLVDAWGRQVGGWLRAERGSSARPAAR